MSFWDWIPAKFRNFRATLFFQQTDFEAGTQIGEEESLFSEIPIFFLCFNKHKHKVLIFNISVPPVRSMPETL